MNWYLRCDEDTVSSTRRSCWVLLVVAGNSVVLALNRCKTFLRGDCVDPARASFFCASPFFVIISSSLQVSSWPRDWSVRCLGMTAPRRRDIGRRRFKLDHSAECKTHWPLQHTRERYRPQPPAPSAPSMPATLSRKWRRCPCKDGGPSSLFFWGLVLATPLAPCMYAGAGACPCQTAWFMTDYVVSLNFSVCVLFLPNMCALQGDLSFDLIFPRSFLLRRLLRR